MKYLLILFTLFTISCNSQTISLEAAAQCLINPNCPDYNYEKDINNSLNKYIGTWKGNYEEKTYEIKFNKSLYQDTGIKRDKITGRLRITDTAGQIIYNTFNESDDSKTHFSGLGFQPNLKSYMVYFVGNKTDCIDYGIVYLKVNASTPNKMTMYFLPDNDIVIEGKCTNAFIPTLPYRKTITLIKQ